MSSPIATTLIYSILGLGVAYYFFRLFRIAAPLPTEKRQQRSLIGIGSTFLFLWLISGIFALYERLFLGQDLAKSLAPLTTTVFSVHLFLWMLSGMVANYLWDLFRAQKDWTDIKFKDLFLPVLVSPIVFYTIWGFASNQPVSFVLVLIAFQNGFFWQVILAKAAPIGQQNAPLPAQIPPSAPAARDGGTP